MRIFIGITFLLLLFVSFSIPAFSQHTLTGSVHDQSTGTPLPFVSIVYSEQGHGLTTSLSGEFSITTSQPVKLLRVSYMGYSPLAIPIAEENYKRNLLIGLEPTAYSIDEVTVTPGVNPAHRIIDSVYRNVSRNNPENLNSFRYRGYNKMHFTYSRDTSSLGSITDTLATAIDTAKTLSPLEQKLDELKRRQHFLLIESIVEHSYLSPGSRHERVLASRESGGNTSMLAASITQFQPFSFYSEHITLLDGKYLNPISRNSTSRYLFILEDTLLTDALDTLFIISYRPLRNRTFPGLKGVMTITNNGWAIQNVIAEPANPPPTTFISIKVHQRYDLVNGIQWFPMELNTDIFYHFPILHLRDTVKSQRIPIYMLGSGSTYIKDVELNPPIRSKEFSHIAISFDPKADRRDDTFWSRNRVDSLTLQEQETYAVMDSLDIKDGSLVMESLLTGRLPVSYFNINLNRLLGYNEFEGFRLGFGLETNRRVVEWLTLGGYYAYGFRDRGDKYGGHVRAELSRKHQLTVEGCYQHDVREPGGLSFQKPFGMIDMDSFRDFMIWRMDYVDNYNLRFNFRALKHFTVGIEGSQTHFNVASGYTYNHPLLSKPDAFTTTELGAEIRMVWNETFMLTPTMLIPLGYEFPMLWIRYHRGIPSIGGKFNYGRLEFRVDQQFDYRTLGKTHITLSGGFLEGDIPTPLLHFAPGINYKYQMDATHAFATMKFYEFTLDRYAYAFIRHNFGRVWNTQSSFFVPELHLVQNIGIGDYRNDARHSFPDGEANTLNKGYFESGLILTGILPNQFYSLGVGAFYRWGAYSFPNWEDNFAMNMTLNFNF